MDEPDQTEPLPIPREKKENTSRSTEQSRDQESESSDDSIVSLPREALRKLEEIGADPADPVIKSVIAIATRFAGPIPSPEILRGYKSIDPALADKIVRWYEEQSAHRRALERASLEGEERRENRAQIFTFVVSGIGIVASAVVGIYGSWTVGCVLAIAAIVRPPRSCLRVFLMARPQSDGLASA